MGQITKKGIYDRYDNITFDYPLPIKRIIDVISSVHDVDVEIVKFVLDDGIKYRLYFEGVGTLDINEELVR